MASKHKVVFAGLARDCAHALPGILQTIEDFGEELSDWGYVFLENNSVDNSFQVLSAFDRRLQRGIVRSFGDLQAEFQLRTERLAMLRNRCIEEIFADSRLREFDYLIVMDLDAVNEQFDKSRILELLDTRNPEWTAMFANQSERYYDIWALRHPTLSPDDCWRRVRERPENMSKEEALQEFVVKRRKKLDPSRGFIPVDSAFGGFGLYRLQPLNGCRYVGVAADGEETCEHVAFHECLTKNGGQLFIDASLINGRGNHRHNAGMSFKTKLLRKINKRLNRSPN
ncbi:hypothetical protein [Hoeflea poritis]|uniref:Uncharacterized protein n=1 Tax=Hoeflea poritis TaxID=2993659 RepID=A0ABT4VGE1_9HYPH|nr:hypothetical protein [Hoeflea poritis]MDA4843775.1 hypothetical protein [Hoeflea poritis]